MMVRTTESVEIGADSRGTKCNAMGRMGMHVVVASDGTAADATVWMGFAAVTAAGWCGGQ